ncbi:BtpA/SgcQ family protein [Haloplanus rallus]|jgi:membrane complex biogenesis BtpA family protein|uniref:BtpA/SgcQ family protein n=1 Tax=Haloplanus rallus TaxID=1816183 RepID=A0A6B9FDC6_9EURY|nr:BtpA/SgcQ family protein [Haloplanus rallus]QGX94420.1 BtpA/SgcQ family protein [Haloplanus rallus]
MTDLPRIVGMVHLPPLPGSPGFDGDRAATRDRVRADARALAEGGVDALLVENFGDAPFYPETVPRHVVASMTDLTRLVVRTVDRPVGVNVLRNDATAALSAAAAAGADFVRVNVHTGARVADQGVIEGRAHETLRLRDRLDTDVSILADTAVKHSAPLGGTTAADGRTTTGDDVDDLVERGRADGVIASGPRTGEGVDRARLEAVAERCGAHDVPLYVGSGVTAGTVGDLLDVADGVIVGTALKRDGETTAPVDPSRVRALVEAADYSSD